MDELRPSGLTCEQRFTLHDVHEILRRYADAQDAEEPSIGDTFQILDGLLRERKAHAEAHAEAMSAVRLGRARTGIVQAAQGLFEAADLGEVARG